MANTQNSSGNWFGGLVAAAILLYLLASWIHIPGEINPITGEKSLKFDLSTGMFEEPSELQIVTLAFADGFLVGWADELAVKIFYSESPAMEKTAMAAFRDAAILGEEKYSFGTIIFLLFGTIFSLGGVIAVWMARNADNMSNAFKMGFFAEIAESVVYYAGYYSTMQKTALSVEEVVITIIVAFFMGFAATRMYKRYHR